MASALENKGWIGVLLVDARRVSKIQIIKAILDYVSLYPMRLVFLQDCGEIILYKKQHFWLQTGGKNWRGVTVGNQLRVYSSSICERWWRVGLQPQCTTSTLAPELWTYLAVLQMFDLSPPTITWANFIYFCYMCFCFSSDMKLCNVDNCFGNLALKLKKAEQ